MLQRPVLLLAQQDSTQATTRFVLPVSVTVLPVSPASLVLSAISDSDCCLELLTLTLRPVSQPVLTDSSLQSQEETALLVLQAVYNATMPTPATRVQTVNSSS